MTAQPFRNPIPSEPWTTYILESPLANPPSPGDDLVLMQNGGVTRLPYSQAGQSVFLVPVQSGAIYQVTSVGSVIAISKTVGSPTTVLLEAIPVDGRRVEVGDWKGDAGTNPITISGNGKVINGLATYILPFNYQSVVLTYSAILGLWNAS